MNFYIGLNRDEIQENLPYALIAETMGSSRWNTGKRRRLMKEQFTESEIAAIYRIYKQARSWHCVKGVPEEIQMTIKTYRFWHKLANFCCEI